MRTLSSAGLDSETAYTEAGELATTAGDRYSALLSRIRVRRGGPVYLLPADFRGDELAGQDGQKNPVEYVAWEGLHNDKPTLSCETAHFTRGFVIA